MIKPTALYDRNTLLHLRLPFSFFLLPVFCFGISQAQEINVINTIILFAVLHFFIYPGSNIYNSYMDDDKGPIGGLKNPPPATKKLFYVSIILDLTGLLLCVFISLKMVLLVILYILVSKAYSWKGTRLKQFAITGWITVMLFQGGYTYLLVNMAAVHVFSAEWFTLKNLQAMLLSSLLIGGYYPLTQIYQHEEDGSRGDFTISYKLGIYGTFIFSGIIFLIACIAAWSYFHTFYSDLHFMIFMVCLIPVIVYYSYWFFITVKDKRKAAYTEAMRMTSISSCCMLICFCILFYLNHV